MSSWKILAVLVLALATALPSAQAANAPSPKADAATVKLVKLFLKTPVNELPPDQVDNFMAVDPQTLPKTLQSPYKVKKLQLSAIIKLHAGKKKGMLRQVSSCEISDKPGTETASLLLRGGFVEITADEENFLQKKTRCTEQDQMCEFSLQIVNEHGTKKKQPRRRYFLFCDLACDPLMALVDNYRQGIDGQGNNFFGAASFPSCNH